MNILGKLYWPIDSQTNEVSLEPIKAVFRGGMYHIPKSVLKVAPLPQKAGFAVVASEGFKGTEYVQDHRGETIYNTTDGREKKTIATLGEIAEDWTLDIPTGLFDEWTANGWQYSQDKERPVKIATERYWRDQALTPLLQRISQYERDQSIAEQFRTSQLTVEQYEGLLADRKALCDYPDVDGFPFSDRPVLSIVGAALLEKAA